MVRVTTHSKNPNIPIFVVEGWQNGDTIAVADLTPPFNQMCPVQYGHGIAAWAWAYEDKQYGYAYFTVDENGSGKLSYEFTNHKSAFMGIGDGDTFTAACALRDENKNILYIEAVQRGVNAGGNTGWVEVPIVHEPSWWQSVKYITFYFGRYQKQDDQKNWNVVLEFAKQVFEALNSGGEPPSEPTPVESPPAATFATTGIPPGTYPEPGGKQLN